MKTITLLYLILSSFLLLQAQEIQPDNIAVLPFIFNGIDFASVQTAESILRMELERQSTMKIISEKRTFEALGEKECSDEECAKEVGQKLGAKQVLLCKLNPLGEKIIVQYILVETSSGKNLLSEQATAVSVEDLELVMKRVAISVAKLTPFSANAEVGSIVGEESVETLNKASRFNFGVGFGYLFPAEGYVNDKKSFTLNIYLDYEIQQYAVGMMGGARDGFAMNIYGNYLFSKTDFCPYVGGALGFHWVASHDDVYVYSPNPVERDSDGIELGLSTGLRILHTYNIQIMINFEYIMTFNDYNDKAFVFTIGIL